MLSRSRRKTNVFPCTGMDNDKQSNYANDRFINSKDSSSGAPADQTSVWVSSNGSKTSSQSSCDKSRRRTIDPGALAKRKASLEEEEEIDEQSIDPNNLEPPVEEKGPLTDVVAYVEVYSGREQRYSSMESKLRELGATLAKRLTKRVTHVIFKEGMQKTVEKARALNVCLVNVLWVDSCYKEKRKVDEEPYTIEDKDEEGTPIIIGKLKKQKSVQPKPLAVEAAFSAERLQMKSKRTNRLRDRLDQRNSISLISTQQSPNVPTEQSAGIKWSPLKTTESQNEVDEKLEALRNQVRYIADNFRTGTEMDSECEGENTALPLRDVLRQRFQDAAKSSPLLDKSPGSSLQNQDDMVVDDSDSNTDCTSRSESRNSRASRSSRLWQATPSPYEQRPEKRSLFIPDSQPKNSQCAARRSSTPSPGPKKGKSAQTLLFISGTPGIDSNIIARDSLETRLQEPPMPQVRPRSNHALENTSNVEAGVLNGTGEMETSGVECGKVTTRKDCSDRSSKSLRLRLSSSSVIEGSGRESPEAPPIPSQSVNLASSLFSPVLEEPLQPNILPPPSDSFTAISQSLVEQVDVFSPRAKELESAVRSAAAGRTPGCKENTGDEYEYDELDHVFDSEKKRSFKRGSVRALFDVSANDFGVVAPRKRLLFSQPKGVEQNLSKPSRPGPMAQPLPRKRPLIHSEANEVSNSTSRPNKQMRLQSNQIDDSGDRSRALPAQHQQQGSPITEITLKTPRTCRKSQGGFPKPRTGLVMTGLHREERDIVIAAAKKLGGFVIQAKVNEATTHVVCQEKRRTLNVMNALVRGCWIVTLEWVIRSIEEEKWEPEEKYEATQLFPVSKVSRENNHIFPRLFSSLKIPVYVVTNSTPPRGELIKLLKLCGAKVMNTARRAHVFIGPNPFQNAGKFIKETWVLDSIEQGHCLDLEDYVSTNYESTT